MRSCARYVVIRKEIIRLLWLWNRQETWQHTKRQESMKAFITCFRIVATVLVFVGAILSAGVVWDTADMLQGIMVVINVPVILILGGRAIAALKDYKKQRKEGKSPEFKSANIGLSGKTDCWE